MVSLSTSGQALDTPKAPVNTGEINGFKSFLSVGDVFDIRKVVHQTSTEVSRG